MSRDLNRVTSRSALPATAAPDRKREKMNARVHSFIAVALVVVVGQLVPGVARSQGKPAGYTPPLVRPAEATGTVVVPDRFLRRWDPVTVFFAHDAGPAAGGPEDHPEKLVTLTPPHPGAFTWIDARTLQFRPAEPWPPLVRFTWTVHGATTRLSTLMEPPISTIPTNNAERLDVVEAISLTFREPLDQGGLLRMVTVELRPLPGIGPEGSRWLKGDDFALKAVERRSPSDAATYVLNLANPIPLGTRAIVHLRLSLDDDPTLSFTEVTFATAEPFRVVSFGCDSAQVPVTPDGNRYAREQALRCDANNRRLVVRFSSSPSNLGPVQARNLVRLTPAVGNLTFLASGSSLVVSGDFAAETLYRVALAPTTLKDTTGRPLDLRGASEVYVAFPRKSAYLNWGAAYEILERYGPQMVPLGGRADERVDLRIHRIDPLDRSFWPFPDRPLEVDEALRPPGPGEEPRTFTDPNRTIERHELVEQVRSLGTPAVSTIVRLPLRREGRAATFGLDLEPHLAYAGGKGQPGTYLVGIRRLDAGSQRAWMRVQVTDLALATFEEAEAVRFVVTSLATSAPVGGAHVRVEGTVHDGILTRWQELFAGTTDAQGAVRWRAPGLDPHRPVYVRRIVVEKDNDVLVLDPRHAPDGFADGHWNPTHQVWLQWTQGMLAGRAPGPADLCHIFTERPVYRPEETVHIKGYVRVRDRGTLRPLAAPGTVVVEGPGNLVWRFPVIVSQLGSFYQAFAAEKLPTGVYRARFQDGQGATLGTVAFRMEAYRIPEFEVQLHTPDRTPLDREFKVALTATYYAGGQVAAQPVRWRVTQFPYTWTPKGRKGFLFSTDSRYSSMGRFESSPTLQREDVTDEDGGASLVINPAIEATAQPRTYVVEATVTGANDQTVTAVEQVVALPPFVLGLKVPRFIERATTIEPEILVLGHDDAPLAGQLVTVRLLHRQWHSVLQASDFSEGKARYVTDIVDDKVFETKVTSGTDVLKLPIPITAAGVYVVELESADRLGRSQVISVDLYAGGTEAVAWPKPTTAVFTVATDKTSYDPDDTANLVLQSPFQKAVALAVVETPEGNEYSWVRVEGGSATFRIPVRSTYVPRLPVHFVLMRGRIPGTAPAPGSSSDLGKPATMAATSWLTVNPVDNRVEVKLEHPDRALPAQKIPVTVRLSDPHGKPLAGEVTLWLVDQAVLALGKEQRLDPLPDFITPVNSRLEVRDTRNLAVGQLAYAELPGGGRGERDKGLMARTTVRRNFKTVPYYNPAIEVGPDGTVTVTVELPDNLTNFKLRAKAISGPDRFGIGTSQVAVRLPVIVQPALPRFVRPGDAFTGAAIGRVVEGAGGPGKAEIQVQGVNLKESATRDITWVANRPERLDFGIAVPMPPLDEKGQLSYQDVTFRVAVERSSDGARDAFEVKLPIRDDRRPVAVRQLVDLEAATPLAIPALPEPARAGSVWRSVLLSDQPGLIRMAAGLNFLLTYPYGCTEQRISCARAELALRTFRAVLHQRGSDEELDRAVRQTLEWLPGVVDRGGLAAYWPGSPGYVSLTAWVVQFLVEAKDAGYQVDPALLDTLTATLERTLRSDYSRFISGEAFAERCWALVALAQAGKFDPAYAAELARKAQFLDLEAVAVVLQSFARNGDVSSLTSKELATRLWDGVVIRLWQGHEAYGGLQATTHARNGLILPSETRTVAEVTRALVRADPANPRVQVLINGLVTLGRGDGWGTTNANATALLALAEVFRPPFGGSTPHTARVHIGDETKALAIGPDAPVANFVSTRPEGGEVALDPGGAGPVVVRVETTYTPEADGSHVAPQAEGFVVSRELLRQRGPGEPPDKIAVADAGQIVAFTVGDVVEEHVQVVNPSDRFYVAVVVPLAAGMEPLNPSLATAPKEAKPAGVLTLAPTYAAFLDDSVSFYYDSLRKGTYDFYFRTRATIPGAFIQPAAQAELMYDGTVRGNGAGARVEITRKP
jgi:uncharacterized protein YfaS (alpha-2-macroglobulin family)